MTDDIDLAALTRSWASQVRRLKSWDADAGFDDLTPVADLVRGARVVGLGESAHGSSELFRLKHRLIEYLVTQLGFTAVAFESSHAACLAIDAYVRHGSGDPGSALADQGYTAWDCDEVSDLLTTLREYNQRTDAEHSVAFWGLDSGFNAAGRRILSRQLDRVDPQLRARTRDAFATLDQLEPLWPYRLRVPEFEAPLRGIHQVLEELNDTLGQLWERERVPGDEVDPRRLLMMMRRWTGEDRDDRSHQMGETLLELLDQAPEECRVVVWAHNGHIGRGTDPEAANLGDTLTDRLGRGYVSLAVDFGAGSVNQRRMDADLACGELVAEEVDPAPVGSLPWCLTATGHQALVVNLRDRPANSVLDGWLAELQTEHGLGWIYTDSSEEESHLAEKYDGIVYVQHSSPSHPTPHARRVIANREGF